MSENKNLDKDGLISVTDLADESARGEKTRGKKTLLIILLSCAAVLLIVYFAFAMYFRNHFFFKSTLNGVSSSGDTVSEAVKKIEKKAEKYTLSIKETDGSETLTNTDIGLKTADNTSDLSKILKNQNEFAWISSLVKPVKYESPVVVNYDQDKLDTSLKNLSDVKNENPVKTEDARLFFDNGNSKYDIEKEIYGTEVNFDELKKTAGNAIINLKSTVDLKADKCYVLPKVKSDDPVLNTAKENLNKIISIKYTYKIGSQTETIPGETLAGFVSYDKDGNVTYNDDAIASFVKDMAAKYDTAGKPKKLVTYTGSEVTVQGGSYGWKVDKAKEAAKIKEDLQAGKDVSRDLIYSRTAASHDGNDYGNSYIEVNRTGQYMVVHKDGQVVLQSKVVTGNVTKGRETHLGAYSVAYKAKNVTLRGQGYASPVSYWMPFHNGEGFHDATWQPSFGGTYYKVRGSHGCVNLPLNIAQQLYGIVSAGYPVLVYDLPGTEDSSYNQSDANAVISKIDAIGDVTADSQAAIEAARKSYDKLTPEAKSLVTNYGVLQQDEAALSQIQSQGAPAPETPQQ